MHVCMYVCMYAPTGRLPLEYLYMYLHIRVQELATFISLVGCGQEFAADFAQKFDTVIRFTKKKHKSR